jgi:hypothetical protein
LTSAVCLSIVTRMLRVCLPCKSDQANNCCDVEADEAG